MAPILLCPKNNCNPFLNVYQEVDDLAHIFSMSACSADYTVTREDFFRELLKFSLSPKRKTRGSGLRVVNMESAKELLKAWIFVSDKNFDLHRSCKTLTTFAGYRQGGGEYFTPNGFYNRHRREKRFLRHLNALFVDIDITITPAEVLDLISLNNLPLPSAIVRTPGGGCHVYWFLDKPVPGTPKAVAFYESLQGALGFVLGADSNAIGAERYMRIPSPDLTHYWNLDRRYTLQDFADWRTLYLPGSLKVYFKGEHPGVNLLLQGVEEGRRNCSAFTLSLHYKCLGMAYEWTLDKLIRWNDLNDPPLARHELEYTVQRVYRLDKYRFYPYKKLSVLSGIKARGVIRTPRLKRENRKHSHYTEWIADLRRLLKGRGGMMVTTIRGLAKELGCCRSSLEKVMAIIKREHQNEFRVTVIGRGNKRRTIIQLLQQEGDEVAYKNDDKETASYTRVHVSSGGWVGTPPEGKALESKGLEGG